jgi:hypothetical protein
MIVSIRGLAIALSGATGTEGILHRLFNTAVGLVARRFTRRKMMVIAVTSKVAVVRMEPEDSNIAVQMAVNAQGRAPAKLHRHDEHQKDGEQATHGCDSTRLRMSAKRRTMQPLRHLTLTFGRPYRPQLAARQRDERRKEHRWRAVE